MRQKFIDNTIVRKLVCISLVGIFLMTLLFGFTRPTTASAASSEYSPEALAKAWQAGMALDDCATSTGFDGTQTAEDLNKGGIFNPGFTIGGPINRPDDKSVGYLLSSSNGSINCESASDALQLFSAAGITNPLSFLKQTGLYGLNSDKTAYEYKLGSDSAGGAAMKNAVAKKYGFTYASKMPNDLQYASLYATFIKKCRGSTDDTGVPVSIVDSTGQLTTPTPRYVLKGGENDVVEVGYSLDGDGGNDGKMSCPTIIKQMNKFANDYAATVTANLADSNPKNDATPGGGANGLSDNKPTCEANGDPTTWFMCPIFNGVADLTDWMFRNMVEPLLRVSPVSTDPANGSFQVWSSFRIYGNIILVISMLVIVFGQAIGGGLIDAYTAKKVMPRIFVAAILVNLSIYLVAIAVDITNILGGGIGQLLTSPFKDAAMFQFSPNATQSVGIVGLAGLGSIAAFISGAVFAGGLIGAAAPWLALFVLLPALLGILGAFVTIVIRQGLILLLIMVSPVAFALYCLPNTEKYFKKWFELLIKTLLVYPIIIVIFAGADILSVTVMRANDFGNGPLLTQVPANVLAAIIAFVAQFLPLMMIPWAFKFAGGIVGTVYGTLSGFSKKGVESAKGQANNPNSARNKASKKFRDASILSRSETVASLNSRYSKLGKKPLTVGSRLQRRGLSAVASQLYRGGGLEASRSALNKEESERISLQSGYGPDDTIRKAFAREHNGRFYDYKDTTYSGEEIPAAQVRAARENLGTTSALQEGLSYEMGKSENDDTFGALMTRYTEMAKEKGWSENTAQSIWTGSAYKNKGLRLEQKHQKIKKNDDGTFEFAGLKDGAFAQEFGTKIRSYEAGGFQASTFGAADAVMDRAVAAGGTGTAGLADTSEELRSLQNLYHGLTNLESPVSGSGGSTGTPSSTAPAPSGMSFGASGVVAARAKVSLDKIKVLAAADPRIMIVPPEAGNYTPK